MERSIKLMEVCGTHTMAIARAGIKKLLPKNIELISGPGCPVCVTAPADIDRAIHIAKIKGVIMTTFGDMVRVPGTDTSLAAAKTSGADVRIVYSPLDALNIARENPEKQVVFMGVGFETTSPTIAATILEAKEKKIKNFFVLSNFKLIPPAMQVIAESPKIKIDGFICPGHVSVIIGAAAYKDFARQYKKPCVITGFGEADILRGISLLVELIRFKKNIVEIAYKRAVKKEGNLQARRVLYSVFEIVDSDWRGLGTIKKSGLKLKKKYKAFDAENKFKVKIKKTKLQKGCICGEILQGAKAPYNCRLFKKSCNPQRPLGACMVSSEGTCAAYYKYGR
ncbi:MAG: hydrogenase formation protein HypD [Candidatus Omnitrophota bacterium]